MECKRPRRERCINNKLVLTIFSVRPYLSGPIGLRLGVVNAMLRILVSKVVLSRLGVSRQKKLDILAGYLRVTSEVTQSPI